MSDRDLSRELIRLLGVDDVWCDTTTAQGNQQFVLWAGTVLGMRYVAPTHDAHACCSSFQAATCKTELCKGRSKGSALLFEHVPSF